jgi:hypothetical protein
VESTSLALPPPPQLLDSISAEVKDNTVIAVNSVEKIDLVFIPECFRFKD